MKAISLWQPWASAIVLGKKRIETRSWPTRYRGPLAIHAAKRPLDVEELLLAAEHGLRGYRFPLGAVLATCDLVACEMTAYLRPSEDEAAWGNFTPGRWGWVLENVRPLEEPVPARGFQMLWNWEPPDDTRAASQSEVPDPPPITPEVLRQIADEAREWHEAFQRRTRGMDGRAASPSEEG